MLAEIGDDVFPSRGLEGRWHIFIHFPSGRACETLPDIFTGVYKIYRSNHVAANLRRKPSQHFGLNCPGIFSFQISTAFFCFGSRGARPATNRSRRGRGLSLMVSLPWPQQSADGCAAVDEIHHCAHSTAPPKFHYFNTKNVPCPKTVLF